MVARILRNPLGLISLGLMTVIILAAAFATVISPFDPGFANVGNALATPGGANLLGTDSAGRDVLSRLLAGAQLTLLSALVCAAVAIVLGLPAGLVAGYYGGRFDTVASWVMDMLISLPSIIVLLSVRAALGPSVWTSMIVFGFMLAPGYFRLTRTAVKAVRGELYIDAARVAGLGDGRIISRHIASVVRAPLIIQTALICGIAIAVQSGLQFLGLGDPSEATWGEMLGDGFSNIYVRPLLMVWPALAIGITIGALVLFGNAVRDALEDRRDTTTAGSRRSRRAAIAKGVERSRALTSQTDSDGILTVCGLSIGYPQSDGSVKEVVSDASWSVRAGEVLGIVGESGSGKSQTAFSVLGLLPASAAVLSGTVKFDGEVLIQEGKPLPRTIDGLRGRRIAYIPQEPMSNLDPAFTIGYQLVRPMVKVLGITKKDASQEARTLLARVGILDPERTMRAYPHEISGGMAQRVLIAGAISCKPDLIIADEPTTALDVTVQAEVLDIIRDMQRELDLTVVIVTHNMGVIADLADRVVVMHNGRVVEAGTAEDILLRPSDPYTQRLLDSTLVGKEPMSVLTGESRATSGVPPVLPKGETL